MTRIRRWIKRFQYRIDHWYSSGPAGPVLSLAGLSLFIVLVSTLILWRTGLAPANEPGYSVVEAFWTSLVRVLGGGSIGLRGTPWGFRLIMFGITMGSIFVVSLLIGTLTNFIRGRIDELRKGRTEVIERDHIVILGWTAQIYTILAELLAANASQKDACLVILAPEDKTLMEDRLRQKLGKTGRTRIVCRTGSPMEPDDLRIVNLNATRSIVILSPESDNPDADVIKTVLAITNHPNRRSQPYRIVACVRDPRNMAVARVAGRHEVEWIHSGHMVSRIIAQTCRQGGLSMVYTELLNFGWNEIYFHEDERLVGRRFGELLGLYSRDSVIGILNAEGWPCLNPAMDMPVRPGDRVILIARDDDRFSLDAAALPAVQESSIQLAPPLTQRPERTLLLGWNWRAPIVIEQLDQYVVPGSDLLIVAGQKGLRSQIEALRRGLRNLKVSFQRGDITDRAALEALELARFQHVILMCYSDLYSPHQADANALITLLHLRDIADQHGSSFTITSEMMDDRNRKLARATRADDFIVSERLVSLMMAQVAENRAVNGVFEEMFDSAGSEVYLKPASSYICLGQPVSFYTVVEAARRRGEVAFGYRQASQARDKNRYYGVVVNPEKSAQITFSENDRVIVLAKD